MSRWALAALLALAACTKAKPQPAPVDPDAEVVGEWESTAGRLPHFLQDGFVVSIRGGDTPVNQGDSLLWTGIAMSSVSCAMGEPMAAAAAKMVADLHGGLYRHPSLPGAISLDGALGFWRGVTHRIVACHEKDRWRPLLALHQAAGLRLNPAADVRIPAPFDVVKDQVLHLVDLGGAPDPSRVRVLEDAVVGWAAAVEARSHVPRKQDRGSCYPVHLGLVALQTIEAAGGSISGPGRDAFCQATAGLDMPTTDHWCGRGDLVGWAKGFQHNVWQYRHQRCPSWETPDGGGDEQPGVDFLRALADAYRFVF